MPDQIEQITAGMAAGNEEAVEAFYRRYFEWLYSQARRASRCDEAFCMDVVQEAVLKIIRSVKKVESEPAFLAWMKLVIQTTVLDLWKQEGRRKKREMLAVAGRNEVVETSEEVETIEQEARQIEWLKKEIAKLDPILIEMIEMRFDKQCTLSRIGQWFGLSAGTIDGRLRRALSELKRKAPTQLLNEASDD